MMKQKIITFGLCFWMHSMLLAADSGKELCYSIYNHQAQPMILHCNVYHPTGEKGPSFDQIVLPGNNQRLVRQNLEKNCKEVAVVVCKLKKSVHGGTIEYFWVSIPCEKIDSQHALELEISKDNRLTARYP